MTSNLIPEQRPDKNGNVVTRWVRGMFKSNVPVRDIPKATLGDAGQLGRQEAKEIYKRLTETTTGIDERFILKTTFDEREYDVLPLLDTFGATHGIEAVHRAAGLLRSDGLEPKLTDANLSAFVAISGIIKEAFAKTLEEDGPLAFPDVSRELRNVPHYVLLNPDDGPILERIIRQGTYGEKKIFDALQEIKDGRLSPVVSEGFL